GLAMIYRSVFGWLDIRRAAGKDEGIHGGDQVLLLVCVAQGDEYWFAPGFADCFFIIGDLGAIALRFLFRRSPGDAHTGPVRSFGAHGMTNPSIRGGVRQPSPSGGFPWVLVKCNERSSLGRGGFRGSRLETKFGALEEWGKAGKVA